MNVFISKISVVIPVFNSEKTIDSCVNAVLRQEVGDVELEVVIVDDGSIDSTADIARSFDRVIYLRQENSGPAAARNAGADKATGDILCFIDSDCQPCSDWLQTVLRYMAFPDIDVVAGTYGIANSQHMLARCIHQEILYRHQKLMGDWVNVFGSYNVVFRREIFKKVGGFDRLYRTASGEDNDLSYRLIEQGHRIRFAKDLIVNHEHPVSLVRYLFEQFRHGFWRATLYRKHPQMMKGDGYTFLKDILEVPFVLALAGLSVFLIFGLFGHILLALIVLMLVLECTYASVFGLKNFLEIMFFGGVMLLRSFARTFGLMMGFLKAKCPPKKYR